MEKEKDKQDDLLKRIEALEKEKAEALATAKDAMEKYDNLKKDVVVKRTTVTHAGSKYEILVPKFVYQGEELNADAIKDTKKLYEYTTVSVDRRTREKIRNVEKLPLIECLVRMKSSIIQKIS